MQWAVWTLSLIHIFLQDDGETEQTFPFTREKWALLDEETLKEGRTTEEEGGTYISHFTVNELSLIHIWCVPYRAVCLSENR